MTDNRVAILIKKTALVVEKLSNHMLSPYELTSTQFKILMFLYENTDEAIRQADIEEHFYMTNPTVTGILQNLEKKKLVEHVPNPKDKRSKIIVLTAQAFSMKEQLYELAESMEAKVTESLTKEECSQLTSLLNKILKEMT